MSEVLCFISDLFKWCADRDFQIDIEYYQKIGGGEGECSEIRKAGSCPAEQDQSFFTRFLLRGGSFDKSKEEIAGLSWGNCP
jgi:hypothetical protein